MNIQPSSTAVILPCSTQDFGEFISSLLGKPQTITGGIRGPFEITKNDVEDIFALLVQRVSQQNDGTLMQFTAKMAFSDDSSVLLNTIDDFRNYNEVKPVSCVAIHLSWIFLVKFNGKPHPEKQKIDLSIIGGDGSSYFDSETPIFIFQGPDSGFITYRIEHTARTWGADIDSLISSHIKGLTNDIPSYRKWVSKNSERLSFALFSLLFSCSIIATLTTSAFFVKNQRSTISNLQEASNIITPDQISYLLETVGSGIWERFLLTSVVFLLTSLVTSIAISLWFDSTANNLPPSFLLLTRESEKRKIKILNGRRRKYLSFCGSIILSFLQGLVINICYGLWFEQLIKL